MIAVCDHGLVMALSTAVRRLSHHVQPPVRSPRDLSHRSSEQRRESLSVGELRRPSCYMRVLVRQYCGMNRLVSYAHRRRGRPERALVTPSRSSGVQSARRHSCATSPRFLSSTIARVRHMGPTVSPGLATLVTGAQMS